MKYFIMILCLGFSASVFALKDPCGEAEVIRKTLAADFSYGLDQLPDNSATTGSVVTLSRKVESIAEKSIKIDEETKTKTIGYTVVISDALGEMTYEATMVHKQRPSMRGLMRKSCQVTDVTSDI